MTGAREYHIILVIREAFASAGCLDTSQLETDAPVVSGTRVNVDAAVAGVHFPWPCPNPHGAGWRAITAAVSDLASAGAKPAHLLLSLALPDADAREWLEPFARGAAEAAAQAGLQLVGGNVTRGQIQMHTIVTGIDRFPHAGFGEARPGDLIWLSGPVGDAAAELQAMLKGRIAADEARHFWYPEARVALGKLLWEQPWTVGVIDVSDGWIADTLRLVRGVRPGKNRASPGVLLDPDAVPRSPICRQRWSSDPDAAIRKAAFVGGEDYELIFLTRGASRECVRKSVGTAAPRAACIGVVQGTSGIAWRRPPEVALDDRIGYDPYDGSP